MAVPEARELDPSAEAEPERPPAPATGVAVPLELVASDDVRERLAALGRTEDLRLSPSGRRLAIACYAIDRIAVGEIELSPGGVRLTRLELLSSPVVRHPHGVDSVADGTLVVASREARRTGRRGDQPRRALGLGQQPLLAQRLRLRAFVAR
jgi:hypothetical protein